MTDIVERLRAWAECGPNDLLEASSADLFVAADEIERLRAALRYMVENPDEEYDFYRIARVALREKE